MMRFPFTHTSSSWTSIVVCLLLLGPEPSEAKKTVTLTVPSGISTCPSTTINYITATLPQQCLRTSWSSDYATRDGNFARDSLDGTNTVQSGGSAESHTPTVPSTIHTSVASLQQGTHSDDTTISASSTTSTTTTGSTTELPDTSADSESDPLSDNANFLSFEEWKAQMLKKAGQSPENVGGTMLNEPKDGRQRPSGINNALEGLGEEGEIGFEFGGFVSPETATEALPPVSSSIGVETTGEEEQKPEKSQKLSKDAGTTSKRRFNYASFDCAATVLKTNQGSKGSNSILLENKDSYMLNACSVKNKYLIVELCNDILIDTIVLGNFEFFSSTFRNFRVSVSARYPVKLDKWKEIGTFEARNTRGVQAFLIENGVIWARYLRIEFLSHYGNEYYCPISLLRVHGKTMMDDYRADVKASRGEEDNEDDEEEEPEKVVAEPLKEFILSEASNTTIIETQPDETVQDDEADFSFYDDKCPRISLAGPLMEQSELVSSSCRKHRKFCHLAKVSRLQYTSVENERLAARQSQLPSRSAPSTTENGTPKPTDTKAILPAKTLITDHTISVIALTAYASPSVSPFSKPTKSGKSSDVGASSPPKTSKQVEQGTSTKNQTETSVVSASKPAPPSPVPTAANQDSFFKSVHKRLQQLEANSTLSLQYIEEQSRILREAFTKVEKRQLSKTSNFLETLNITVLSELREFRLQYDQIWQSTVLELSAQREQSQREVTALSQRLTFLADEILWQKRLAYLQFGLIMLCLGLVVFSRNQAGTSAPYLDIPLLQNMVARPSASFAKYLNLDSPPGTPSRPSSRYGRFARSFTHLRSPSNDNDTASDEEGVKGAPNIEYQLPTPSSESDEPRLDSAGSKDSPEAELLLRRAQSTPILAQEKESLLDPSNTDRDREGEDGGEAESTGDGVR